MTLKSQCKAKGGTFTIDYNYKGDLRHVCEFDDSCVISYKCVEGFERWNCKKYGWMINTQKNIEKFGWRSGLDHCNKYLGAGSHNLYRSDGSGFGSWTSKLH